MRAIRWCLMAGVLPCVLGASVTLRAQDEVLDSAYQDAQDGAWEASAKVWRRLLDSTANLSGAAAITLRDAGADSRSVIRRLFLAPPLTLGSRRALASLEIDWGTPRAGWTALAPLPPNDAVVSAWVGFATDAQDDGDALTARDAFKAALQVRPSALLALRASYAALEGGDAADALVLIERPELARITDSNFVARVIVPLRARAMARVGHVADAAALVTQYESRLPPDQRKALSREVAWGYVRAGNVDRARTTIAQFGLSDDVEIQAWLDLYSGDLAGARDAVRRLPTMSSDLVVVAALLTRTTADSAPDVGRAFVQLARADTAGAADLFVTAGGNSALHDAAPLLLAMAARLHTAQHDDGKAVPLWREVVERYPNAPEAPEADLEWGRSLKRQSNLSAAIERWEHLILTYPESALVPQARHELELAKAPV